QPQEFRVTRNLTCLALSERRSAVHRIRRRHCSHLHERPPLRMSGIQTRGPPSNPSKTPKTEPDGRTRFRDRDRLQPRTALNMASGKQAKAMRHQARLAVQAAPSAKHLGAAERRVLLGPYAGKI